MNLARRSLYILSRAILKPLVAPELLIISLTECCNLRCITCSIKKSGKEAPEVDLEKIFDVIGQAKQMGIKSVVLSGGEPFLVKEVFEIIKKIKENNMTSCITTNGFYADNLIKMISGSGVDHVHFSFDGLSKGHDEIRGEGTYDKLMHTIRSLRKMAPDISIGCGTVICSKNCADLFEMTKIADELGVNSMNFIPFLVNNIDPQNSKKGPQHSRLWPSNSEVAMLKESFHKIKSHKYRRLKIDANPDFDLLLRYYSLGSIEKKCFAGFKSMIITALRKDGGSPVSDVFFCQDSCGNIYETSLKDAWNSVKARSMRDKARQCRNPCLQFCHYV